MSDLTPIDEAEVVAPLMGFAPFASFYQAQRPRITRPVAWALRPGHESTGSCARVLLPVGGRSVPGWLIVLRERPRSLNDAHTVAHELEHCILDLEGWPLVRCEANNPTMRRFAAGINGLLDVAVENAIARYGFTSEARKSLAAVANILGGPRALDVLRHLEATDLTNSAAVTQLMHDMCAPSGGALRVVFRG